MTDTITIQGEIERQTENAILYKAHNNLVWVPRSQIKRMLVNKQFRYTEIEIPHWLAQKKGLI